MNRRSVLVSTAAALSIGLAGCSLRTTGSADDPPSLPDGLSVETRRWAGCVLTETPICGPDFQESHSAVFTDEATARDRLTQRAISELDYDEFVSETDFSKSFLLLVQHRMQKAPSLKLDAIERADTGLRVAVAVERPDGSYGDVSVPHTLAIRVTDERRRTPWPITVVVYGEWTSTVTPAAVTPAE